MCYSDLDTADAGIEQRLRVTARTEGQIEDGAATGEEGEDLGDHHGLVQRLAHASTRVARRPMPTTRSVEAPVNRKRRRL